MAPEVSRKRLRAPSDELESILFSEQVDTSAQHRSSKRLHPTTTKQKKSGWNAANKPSQKRTAQQYSSKKPGWDEKLAKCKNALARFVVENAFTKHAPTGWKGKRFAHGNIFQKRRGIGAMGQSIIGRGVKGKHTAESIEKRFNTYQNDALRYVHVVSKMGGFERWSKTRKLKVRDEIEQEMSRLKRKELGG